MSQGGVSPYFSFSYLYQKRNRPLAVRVAFAFPPSLSLLFSLPLSGGHRASSVSFFQFSSFLIIPLSFCLFSLVFMGKFLAARESLKAFGKKKSQQQSTTALNDSPNFAGLAQLWGEGALELSEVEPDPYQPSFPLFLSPLPNLAVPSRHALSTLSSVLVLNHHSLLSHFLLHVLLLLHLDARKHAREIP